MEHPSISREEDAMSDSAMTDPAPETDTARTQGTSFSDHLSCGVCLDILSHPYTVLPCLHTFDKECLVIWWRDNNTCPLCKTRARSGRFAFQLNGILQSYKNQRGVPITSSQQHGALSLSTDIIYPVGDPQCMDVDEENSDGEELNDEELENQRMAAITNQIPRHIEPLSEFSSEPIWPCPSCLPGNDTGFICPIPIPIPEGAAMPPPARGARRARLLTSDGQSRVTGAMQHKLCSTCTAYLPAALPIQCLICTGYSCSSIDREGECPNDPPTLRVGSFGSLRRHLRELDSLDIITPSNTSVHNLFQALGLVWGQASSYPRLNSNPVERDRFMHHIVNRNINLSEAILEMIEIEVHITGRMQSDRRGRRDTSPEPDATVAEATPHEDVNQTTDQSSQRIEALVMPRAPTSSMTQDLNYVSAEWKENPNTRVCEQCITRVIKDQIHRWWERERSRGSVEPSITSLHDCWYGRECRTQTHNQSHAQRYNHVCDNTSMARGRGYPRAE